VGADAPRPALFDTHEAGRDALAARLTEHYPLLEVRTDNDAAIGLYASEGFTRVGIRRRYYQPSGADAYTMARPK